MTTPQYAVRTLKYAALAIMVVLTLFVTSFAATQVYLAWKDYPAAAAPLTTEQIQSELIPTIVTLDADGSRRVTQLWIVSVDGNAYLRTGNSQWYQNLQRDPDLTLRIAGAASSHRAEFINEPELEEQVQVAFRQKYPQRSAMFSALGRHPENLTNIIRLQPLQSVSSR